MNSEPCRDCGWSNPPQLTLCQQCGSPLGAPERVVAAPSAPEPQGYYGQQGYAPPAYYPPAGSAAPKKGVSTGVIVAVAAAVVAVGVVLIGIVAAIAIPSLLAARRASNEAAVVGSIHGPKAAFRDDGFHAIRRSDHRADDAERVLCHLCLPPRA